MCRGAAQGPSRRGTAAGHPMLTGWLWLAPPRGAASSLGGRAGGDAPCLSGSGARAGVPATAQRVLQNTGSHVSLLSHRLKNEETLLDGKQGKKKRKKVRMMCSWTTAPSQFTLGAKSTHRSLPIE